MNTAIHAVQQHTQLLTSPSPQYFHNRSGIDVLLNAESVRETPAMVSFGDKQRYIGVHAAGKVRRLTEIERDRGRWVG